MAKAAKSASAASPSATMGRDVGGRFWVEDEDDAACRVLGEGGEGAEKEI